MSYADWIKRFAALFGMAREDGLVTLRAWADEFRRQGVTPEMLQDATTEFFRAGSGPSYPADLLRGLQASLQAIRRRKTTSGSPDASDRVCGLCGASGVVYVPSEKSHAGEEWREILVACRCPAGKRTPFFPLEAYEEAFPDWLEVSRQHYAEARLRRPSRSNRTLLDRTLDDVVRRITRGGKA